MLRAIQRHRDVFQDYGREFRRTKVRTSSTSYRPYPSFLFQVVFLVALLIHDTPGECPDSRRPG
jgi:hypothetical protein